MKAYPWSWGVLILSFVGLLFLAQYSCKGSSRSQKFKQCHARQTQMFESCRPVCTETPVAGESLDSCLDRCANKKFGEPIPTCTGLSGSK